MEIVMKQITRIVIEVVEEGDGSRSWAWDAFVREERLFGGSAGSLAACLDSMRVYLRDEGII